MLLFSALVNKSTEYIWRNSTISLESDNGYSGNVIHFFADKWLIPSIKDIKHINRDAVYQIIRDF